MNEKDGIVYHSEPYDEKALLSGREPRGPYLYFDGETLRTDIFGQIPLFVSENRVEMNLFRGGVQHDPTKKIIFRGIVRREEGGHTEALKIGKAMNKKEIKRDRWKTRGDGRGVDFIFRGRQRLPGIDVREPVKELAIAFRDSVKLRADGKTGLLLSGGVDSSAIATVLSQEGVDFTAFCVAEGKDIEHAEKLAKKLDFDLVPIHLDIDEVEHSIPEIFQILGMKEYLHSTPVYLPVITSLSITFYFAMKEAEKYGIKRMFSGVGSEELFAGFTDWTGEDIEKQVVKRSYTLYKRDLWRDCALAEHSGMKMSYPFLDSLFAKTALSIPAELKLSQGHKKYVWRKTAEYLGVPHENAWRKNKAAQYGSGSDRILEKLAKTNGKRHRIEYLREMLDTEM